MAAVNEQSPLAVLNEGLRAGDHRILAFIHKRVMPVPNVAPVVFGRTRGDRGFGPLRLCVLVSPGFGTATDPATTAVINEPFLSSIKIRTSNKNPLGELKPSGTRSRILARSRFYETWPPRCTHGRGWPGSSLDSGRSLARRSQEANSGQNGRRRIHAGRPLPWCPRPFDAGGGNWRCLSNLPIDNRGMPAVAYVDDPSTEVRKQTGFSSFSQRNTLLTDEMLFKRLHDQEPMIREMAGLILKTRGLSQEQIGMGGLIFSPRADQPRFGDPPS